MGYGYRYKCESCGKAYDVYAGIGCLLPQEYKKTLNDVAKGKYGKQAKDHFEKTPYIAVDAERRYFECESCGHWDILPGLDLYEPKDVGKLRKKEYGNRSVKELGEVPYVMPDELKTEYKLVLKYEHCCPKCKGIMKRRNIRNVCCPKCGKKNRPIQDVLWD